VATLTFNGKDFTALGSCVDRERGIISAYVGPSLERDENGVAHLPGKLFQLSSFGGKKIGEVRLVSRSRTIRTAWGSHVIEYYAMEFEGHRWHGKKSGEYQLLRLRRGKPVVKPS